MARNWMATLQRSEERLIAACTTLKVKVSLLVDGQPMECGEFTSTRQAGDWMAVKASYWRTACPLSRVRFITE